MPSDKNINLPNITEADVKLAETQLSKILSSIHFKSAKQMQKFLEYVVNEALHGKHRTLKQYSIAVDALGLPDDFDSDSNPTVRILAGRVRERLTKYYEESGMNDAVIISIPKGSYIPEFLTNTESIKPTSSLQHADSTTSCGPKLVLACFKDKTQDDSSNQLLYQISDCVAKELTHFIFLRLAVSIPHADKSDAAKAVEEIKIKYDAEYVMSLYIQQLPNNKYNLLYRVVDSELEEVLWSKSFSINKALSEEDHSKIYGGITSVVADIHQGLLQIHWARKLLNEENSIPICYQTLAYYRYFMDNFNRKAFAKAVKVCSEALQRNPNNVLANVIFSDLCRRDYGYAYGVIDDPLNTGMECAETAIRYKPESHEAHFTYAQILFCMNDWERSIEEFEIARNITQYHTVIEYGTGFYYCMMGNWKEGLLLVKKAMSLSPAYPSWYHLTPFLNYYRQGKYKEALLEAQKIINPSILHGPLARCVSYAQLGKTDKAEKEFKEVLLRFPEFKEKGKHHLICFLGSEELANKIWDGVLKVI
ncbi:MAG: tetratricopeptide repeat protein [Cocleimonas sp.]